MAKAYIIMTTKSIDPLHGKKYLQKSPSKKYSEGATK